MCTSKSCAKTVHKVNSKTCYACVVFGYLQAKSSRIELPAVRYGRQGPWAINLWFKPSNESGNQFQYLFSHNSTEFSDYAGHQYSPNQVWVYSRSW